MRLKNLLEEDEDDEDDETGETEQSNTVSSVCCNLAMLVVFLKLVVVSSSTLNLTLRLLLFSSLIFSVVVVDFSESTDFDFLKEKARNFWPDLRLVIGD